MKASDWIIDFLATRGVDTIYGYIGGMVAHLIDSASRNQQVCFIQTYHEQSAAFAAEGFARERGLPGVVIATSGPGATNLLTGVADAYFDSVPLLCITGQVNTCEYKYRKPVRQQGFQETDIVAMAKPVTKYAVLLDHPERLCYEFEKAWYKAVEGRPGPVLIDLPMDMQRCDIDPTKIPHFCPAKKKERRISSSDFKRIVAALQNAQRPMLLLGAGAKSASPALQRIARSGIPIVFSLQGKGAVSENNKNVIGMIGSYGNHCANLASARADFLLVVGSRLDTRQTGAKIQDFLYKKTVFQVDIDANEMKHHRLKNRNVVIGEATDFLQRLSEVAPALQPTNAWIREAGSLRKRYCQQQEVERFVCKRLPYDCLSKLNNAAGPEDIFVADIGQNQMWAAQTLQICSGQKFMTSGGMAPMGYAIPVAIGAVLRNPRAKRAWAITGDGGLFFALQSLPLIAQYDLPVCIVVMNNASLGMITQFQSLYFQSNFAGTTPAGGYCPPNCEALAKAFDLPYFGADTAEDFESILKGIPKNALLELKLQFPTFVSPKLEYNRPFYDMSPYLPKEELAAILRGKK